MIKLQLFSDSSFVTSIETQWECSKKSSLSFSVFPTFCLLLNTNKQSSNLGADGKADSNTEMLMELAAKKNIVAIEAVFRMKLQRPNLVLHV